MANNRSNLSRKSVVMQRNHMTMVIEVYLINRKQYKCSEWLLRVGR